jgi:methylated-DNA-[protein]-cysteine S-methyltransferase
MGEHYWTVVASPVGELVVTGDGAAVTGVGFRARVGIPGAPGPRGDFGWAPRWAEANAPLAAATEQLAAYFAGELHRFDLVLAPRGTPFRRRVWAAVTAVPYGTTTTYGALAAALGVAGGARAVGAANGANPLAIVVPCHRVLGADRSLTGYGGGLDAKRFLLGLEACSTR